MIAPGPSLTIGRNRKQVFAQASLFVVFAALTFVDLWRHGGLSSWFYPGYAVLQASQTWLAWKALRHVGIDEAGLDFDARRGRIGWNEIAAYAVLDDGKRRIVRLFRKPEAAGAPPNVRLRGLGPQIDIDLSVARDPREAMLALRTACARRLGATRPFGEAPKPVVPSWRSNPKLVAFTLPIGVGLIAFAALFAQRPVKEEPPRPVDARPGQSVLFLGNSRTYGNDLPKMVRDIADSARSPLRYDVHMRAWANATFQELWMDEGDQAALAKHWDYVILQPESGAFEDGAAEATSLYGEKLIRAGAAQRSRVALVGDWTRDARFFDGDAEASRRYGADIVHGTRALAGRANADVIDLAGAFAQAAEAMPEVSLTMDGNQPSIDGSYMAALVIYGYLSHGDLAKVDWRPYDMSAPVAERLKQIAARHTGGG